MPAPRDASARPCFTAAPLCASLTLMFLIAGSGCSDPVCADGATKRQGRCQAVSHVQPNEDAGGHVPLMDAGGAGPHMDAGGDDNMTVGDGDTSIDAGRHAEDGGRDGSSGDGDAGGDGDSGGDGDVAIDAGPCAAGCPDNAACESGTCKCKPGFAASQDAGATCDDVNECDLNTHGCLTGTCTNNSGSYECTCPDGFTGTGTQACHDINECDTSNGGCGIAPCINGAGTFSCGACPAGFLGQDGDCKWNGTYLDSLSVSPSTPLYPQFDKTKLPYFAQLTASTDKVQVLAGLPQQSMGRASVFVNGVPAGSGLLADSGPVALSMGDNSLAVKVVAQTGANRTYQLSLRRGWTFGTHVKAPHPGSGDHFGRALALSADGSTLAVGASEEDSLSVGINGDPLDSSAPLAGAVYVYRRGENGWVPEAYIKASNTNSNDEFGSSVSLSSDGSTLVVGAPGEDGPGKGFNSNPQAENSVDSSGAAYIFERHDQWQQTGYLKASNTAVGAGNGWFPWFSQFFGDRVAIAADGQTIAVAAPGEAGTAPGVGGSQTQDFSAHWLAGAVYVFRKQGDDGWAQEAYVKSATPIANGRFGDGLALSADGSLLAVGEPSHNVGKGLAYTYERNASGVWTSGARIAASNPDMKDEFGVSVAVSADGNLIAVGAPTEDGCSSGVSTGSQDPADNTCTSAGAVYLFARAQATWPQIAYVKASNAQASAEFGREVALSADGQYLAAGAIYESGLSILGGDQTASTSASIGAAYLFHKSDGWSQLVYAKSPTAQAAQYFGQCVSLSANGASLAVSTLYENSGASGVNGTLTGKIESSGAAFIYE
jgi:hypothetical protein